MAVYGFLNAKLRTRIGLSPAPEFLDSLIRAKTLGEALVLLRGGPYAAIESAWAETGELRSGEALLFAREISLHTELLRHAKEPVLSFIAALSLQFEVENLKRALRLWFDRVVLERDSRGASEYLYRAPIVHRLELDALLAAPDYSGLADALQASPYADLIRAEAERFAAERKLFSQELALDRFYFGRLALAVAALEPRDRALAERMLGVEADMRNLAWIARFRSFRDKGSGAFPGSLIPGGHAVNLESLTAAWDSGSFSELLGSLSGARYAQFQALFAKGTEARSRLVLLEQALRHILREEADRLLRGHPFTIGILLAYLVRKREETRTILAILNAKRYGLDEERTREAL